MSCLYYFVTALAFAMSGALAWQVPIFNIKWIFWGFEGGDGTGFFFLARVLSPLDVCVFCAFSDSCLHVMLCVVRSATIYPPPTAQRPNQEDFRCAIRIRVHIKLVIMVCSDSRP